MPLIANEDPFQARDHERAALDASGIVGTWDWDCVRRTARYDAAAAELLAGDADLAGQDLHLDVATASIHRDDLYWLNEDTEAAARTGGLFLSEYRVVTSEGGIRWILSRGRAYHDPFGRPVRCRGILIDISASREASAGYLAMLAPRHPGGLERIAACCLEARRTLDGLGEPDASARLRLSLDVALFEAGCGLARRART